MGKKMQHHLSDMQIEEVSLVYDPANPGANVLFWKRKDGPVTQETKGIKAKIAAVLHKFGLYGTPEQAATFEQVDDGREKMQMIQTLSDSLSSIAGDASLSSDEQNSMMEQSLTEFLACVAQADDETDYSQQDGATQTMKNKSLTKGNEEEEMEIAKMTPEQKVAALAELQKDKDVIAADEAAKVAKAAADKIAKDKETVVKSDMEVAIEKALAPLQEQLKKSNDEVEKLRGEKAEEVRLTKASGMVAGLTGIEAKDVAEMLKGMSDEQATKLETTLKAVSAQNKAAALFIERGSNQGRPSAAGDIAKGKAEEIKKSNPKLSEAQVMAQVWEQNPDLYAQYESEKQ